MIAKTDAKASVFRLVFFRIYRSIVFVKFVVQMRFFKIFTHAFAYSTDYRALFYRVTGSYVDFAELCIDAFKTVFMFYCDSIAIA